MNTANHTDQSILDARAMELARPISRRTSAEGHLDVVEFPLAHECYAIESRFVAEVFPFGDITPLPGTPAFVVGIVNFRGRVLSVIDLKFFFQLPMKGLNDRNRAIVLRSGNMEFGVLVDAMHGTRRIAQEELQEALPTLSGIREKYLKGVTPDGVGVLDGGKLLADDALVVRDRTNKGEREP